MQRMIKNVTILPDVAGCMIIISPLVVNLACGINFNIKMSRQYTQKASPASWNWTDQRVQQIMKKYEQPTPSRNGERTPLRHRHTNQPEDTQSSKSPWRNDYHCKAQTDARQDCRTPQNRNVDSFFKENSYERSDARNGYGRPQEKASSKRTRHVYNNEEEPSSFIIEDYTLRSNGRSNKESQLLDAKNYLREQERKYLKADVLLLERQRESVNLKPQRMERGEPLRSQKIKTEVSEISWGNERMMPYREVEYEPRISNIERINNKIKKILESTNEPTAKLSQTPTPITKSNNNNGLLSKQKPTQLKETSSAQERRIEERSKSCLALKKNIVPSSELSQKVNEHLGRFSNKIAQFEQQKRKLNISFKQNDPQPTEKSQNNQKNTESHKKSIKTEQTEMLINTQEVQGNDFYEENQESSPNFHSPYIGLKELDSRNDSIAQVNLNHQQQIQQITRNMEMRRRQRQTETHESPPEQKKKPSVETGKLLQMLSEQVQLDQKLQLAKKWFSNTAQQSDWALLQELLAQRWREMANEEIQEQFAIALEEEDPFYSYRPEQFQLEDLVANYIISCRHWCEKVEGQWNVQRLREEGCFSNLDRENRGQLAVQDLVREINLSQNVFFRNRNLYLVFQRLTHNSNNALTEDRLYSVLSRK